MDSTVTRAARAAKGGRGKAVPKVTITAVAEHAGVSPSTVSYVLSGNRSISSETQARVRRSIKALDYRPHAGARALRAGKTGVIALAEPFYDWSSEPVLMPYVYGVVDEARRHSWNVMLLTSRGEGSEIDEVVGGKMVDGVILMEVRVGDERLRAIERLPVAAVCLGMPSEPTEVPYVDFDFEGAGRLAVEHLVGLGHRRIALLASPPGTFKKKLGYARRFRLGVTSALRAAGLAFNGVAMEPSMDGVEEALEAVFRKDPETSAIIVHNEGAIDLLMQGLGRRGRAVPTDVSVLSVGWGELTKHLSPPLSYIDVPSVQMGRAAVDLLGAGGPARLLPASVVAGGTVAAAREG
jgi:DNA-binding LacI/PurR family transcriptional regulator